MEFIDLHEQYKIIKSDLDSLLETIFKEKHFIAGPEVKILEKRLAEYCGTKYCLTCANGTDALTLALKAIGVGHGDAVFVSDFTFFASAEAIALEGATPVFVDVDETFNIDTISLENAINKVKEENKLKLKAVIVVDLFGQPADYNKIIGIAKKYGLKIIEDAAQGFGGSINGKKNCSFGDISTTSFFPVKPLGCYGDGGAVFTDNYNYYCLMSSLAIHGKGDDKYDNIRIGINSRLDTIQAGVLLCKLNVFDRELEMRNKVASVYSKSLYKKYKVPLVLDGFLSSWAQYTLIAKSKENRDNIIEKFNLKGIPIMIYYRKPMHCEKVFKNVKQYVSLEKSDWLKDRVFSIPFGPYLDENSQKIIIDTLLED